MRQSSVSVRQKATSAINAGLERLAALSTARTAPLGRFLQFAIRRIPPTLRMPILRGTLRGKRWIAGAGNHAAWLGTYEYEKRGVFERVVVPGSVVFDVGAHVGYYTLLASVLVGREGRVIAFEPAPRNLSFLRTHLAINRVTNATVIGKAVSDRSGTAAFAEGERGSLGYTGHIATGGTLNVETVALDELVMRGTVPRPDTIKIDVEGAEVTVLSGALATLTECRPTILLATHGPDLHRECCAMLRTLGYHIVPIDAHDVETAREILATDKDG